MVSKTQEEFIWGALIAGALSAAAVILFTPISGEKLRNQVRKGIAGINGVTTPKRTYHKRQASSSRKNSSHDTKNGGTHSVAHHHASDSHHASSHAKPARKTTKRAKATKTAKA